MDRPGTGKVFLFIANRSATETLLIETSMQSWNSTMKAAKFTSTAHAQELKFLKGRTELSSHI